MTFNQKEIVNILSNSFILAFKWAVWKWFFSSIGALTTTLLIAKNLFGISIRNSIIISVGILVFIFLLRFFLIFIKESLKYFHEVYMNAVYGDAIILLNECFSSIHSYRKTPEHDDDEFVKAMVLLCNNLQKIFTQIIKHKSSVSIKVPISEDSIKPQTLVKNLVRDSEHSSRDTLAYSQIQHTLLGNSAFIHCLNKVSSNSHVKHYLNNDVNSGENYNNTSKQCYEDGNLPYNSELVFPITPMLSVNNDCLGFICVDTSKQNAFNSKYEIAILEGVADGIYDLISARNQFKLSEDGKKDQN